MTVSYQDLIQAGSIVRPYPASAAVTRGTFVAHDGANGTVSTAASGVPYGIATNDADVGETVFVVLFGLAFLRFAGTVNAGAQIVPTTGGEGIAGTSTAISRCVCAPDTNAGAGYVDNDLGYVLLGSRYLIP